MLVTLALPALLHTFLYVSPVISAVVPVSSTLISFNSSLSARIDPSQCTSATDWIGNGILHDDCRFALNEFWHDDVVPREGRTYEFLRRGVSRVGSDPWVTTPRKHWYQSCTVVIAMMNEFLPGSLPGEPSALPALKSDTATFDQLYAVAEAVYNQCIVQKEPLETESEAGWSFAGASESIGIFIMRNGGDLDNLIIRDGLVLGSNTNASSIDPSINLHSLSGASNVAASRK